MSSGAKQVALMPAMNLLQMEFQLLKCRYSTMLNIPTRRGLEVYYVRSSLHCRLDCRVGAKLSTESVACLFGEGLNDICVQTSGDTHFTLSKHISPLYRLSCHTKLSVAQSCKYFHLLLSMGIIITTSICSFFQYFLWAISIRKIKNSTLFTN